jgi:hypothetical protein
MIKQRSTAARLRLRPDCRIWEASRRAPPSARRTLRLRGASSSPSRPPASRTRRCSDSSWDDPGPPRSCLASAMTTGRHPADHGSLTPESLDFVPARRLKFNYLNKSCHDLLLSVSIPREQPLQPNRTRSMFRPQPDSPGRSAAFHLDGGPTLTRGPHGGTQSIATTGSSPRPMRRVPAHRSRQRRATILRSRQNRSGVSKI